MSTPAPTDPNALRPLLHERIDQWAAEDLALQQAILNGRVALAFSTAILFE